MPENPSGNLYVALSASEVRRRLKGHGFGVRRIESAGKGRAVIVHSATGKHLRQLEAFFQGSIEAPAKDGDGRME
jgi:hypothetical protein